MTTNIIVVLSILLLLAYLFEIATAKVKIPSVILLLLLGFGLKLFTAQLNIKLPDLNQILPVLGTVGLILIVLDGSLELKIDRTKFSLIWGALVVSLLPIIILSFGIAYYLHYFESIPLKIALLNAIPFGIISSAVAIPSARNLLLKDKEFITYESSLSDIFGIIIFNFIALNDKFDARTFGYFGVELLIMIVVSFIMTLVLAEFLDRINHHVKFVPIIISIVLIYTVAKEYHLPALIFILLFGLFMGNIDKLRNVRLIKKFHTPDFSRDVEKFKDVTSEFTFLIRASFFILFGFLLDYSELLRLSALFSAIIILIAIFLLRFITLNLFGTTINPVVFIAPRGLITILLFFSIPQTAQIAQVNKSLVTQVIILSTLVMTFGLIKYKKATAEQTE